MRLLKTLAALGALNLAGWLVVESPAPRQAAGAVRGLGAIRVPDGFRVEVAARSGLVSYPMLGTVDDRGRLFLCESSGHTLNTKQMAARPDYRIRLLEDLDKDGVYDRSTVFADKLTLPAGAVWLRGSLYVAAPPDLLRLEDTDGDGRADRREVILTGWNLSANAASLHGPFLGPDGWLYLTDGRHGYNIKTKEGTTLAGKASRIWRCRPDGTGLESFAGGGFDNPVEVVFTAAGEMIGTMTYFTDPKNGERDALLHFVEGGVYPKPHPTTVEFKRTGELMPVMTKFARIAPSGLALYRGAALGPAYRGNLFSAHFNSHRVQRHVLFRDGATFRTEDQDFLVSSDPDFHPTDVMEDADGSLLVVDTGGWFIHGCPVSRLSKPEIRGVVYRVRRTGPAPPAEQAAPQDDPALVARFAAARAAGMARDPAAVDRLIEMLRSGEPPVRRQAAAALGQIGDKRAVPALLAAAARVEDRFVEHAIVYSLIMLADPTPALAALRAPQPGTRKAALVALDQMDSSPLDRRHLAAALREPDPELRRAALWIVAHRPEWSGEIVDFLRARLASRDLPEVEAATVRETLATSCADPAVQRLVAEHPSFLLETIDGCGRRELPAVWTEPLGRLLDASDAKARLRVISLIRSRGIAALDDRLARLAVDAQTSDEQRVAALGALLARRPQLDAAALDFLLKQLAPSAGADVRMTAAQTLGRARLTEDQLLLLARHARDADPLILPPLIEAFRYASPAARAAVRPALARIEREKQSRGERIRRLEPLLTAGGDPVRGRRIFFGEKVACGSCHTIGVQGGHVGPDLTAVGAVRSGYDLLEAIVFPSASFVPGHEIYRVETATDVYTGVLQERGRDAVVLIEGPNASIRIPRDQIRVLKPSQVSLMPDGLDEALTREEFTDLLAFLQSQQSRESARAGL